MISGFPITSSSLIFIVLFPSPFLFFSSFFHFLTVLHNLDSPYLFGWGQWSWFYDVMEILTKQLSTPRIPFFKTSLEQLQVYFVKDLSHNTRSPKFESNCQTGGNTTEYSSQELQRVCRFYARPVVQLCSWHCGIVILKEHKWSSNIYGHLHWWKRW